MNYFLLFLSITVNAAYSSVNNYLGKKKIMCTHDNYKINAMIYGIGFVMLFVLMAVTWEGASVFTLLFGLIFGLATAFAGVFTLKALSCGPMSFTILIMTSSMILPAFSGALIWHEDLSPLKIIGTLMMIFAAYFTTAKDDGGTSLKWLGYSMAAFLFQGSIGIMQKIQQNSSYAEESTPFLTVAFMISALSCFLFSKLTSAKDGSISIKSRILLPAAVCGAAIAFLNVINLYLSGVLPSALMFPVQNGGTTVLSVLCAIVIFREKLSKRKMMGLAIGMAALLLLIV